jgi:RNA polymerase sigma-70 factor (ECF subfamily)
MTDADLVRLARAGRTESYAELVRRWSARVLALCHSRVGRAGWAEDLAQETLLRGFRSLHTLTNPERFGAWLMGIALRICLDWRKAKQNHQLQFSALSPDVDPDRFLLGGKSPLDEVERADEKRNLLAEVEALPEDYRQVIMLYYYQDLTYRDLADLLGVSTATINARLTRARQMLRVRFEACRR